MSRLDGCSEVVLRAHISSLTSKSLTNSDRSEHVDEGHDKLSKLYLTSHSKTGKRCKVDLDSPFVCLGSCLFLWATWQESDQSKNENNAATACCRNLAACCQALINGIHAHAPCKRLHTQCSLDASWQYHGDFETGTKRVIGGVERKLFYIRHPEHTYRYATVQQLRELRWTLEKMQDLGVPVTISFEWIDERIKARKAKAE